MVNPVSTALNGLNAATTRVAAAASNIANATSEGYTPVDVVETSSSQGPQTKIVPRAGDSPQVDYASELITIKQAAHAYKANLAVIKTTSEMEQELLNSFDENA
jgi:flagellar basal-body rod protein FlgC